MTASEFIDDLESLSIKDVTQDIVIKPVEIEHDRHYRALVVLAARNGEEIRPNPSMYSINGQFLRPTQVNKWVIVLVFDKQATEDFARGEYTFEDIKEFAGRYMRYGRRKGIKIKPLSSIQCIPAQATTEKNVDTMPSQVLKEELRRLFIKLNRDLVNHAIIILPDSAPSWIHGYLQYLETCKWDRESTGGENLGPVADKLMRTSRIRLETLVNLGFESSSKLIPTIWHKFNIKLGGLNVSLKRTFDTHDMKFLNDGHLIISIDLGQLDAQQSSFISVAVGMWDLASEHMSFHTQTRVQAKSSNERVDLMPVKDLEQMTAEIVAAYKKRKDNQIPTRVIVFRVGGYKKTDDEFVTQEILSIKRALGKAQSAQDVPGEQPMDTKLTYLKLFKGKLRRVFRNGRTTASSGVTETTGLLVSSETEAPREGAPKELPSIFKAEATNYYSQQPRLHMHKLYDEANMTDIAVKRMVHALSFLSPRATAMTRPMPIDLADLANSRTFNIVSTWMSENNIVPEDAEFLPKVNRFLATELGDSTYKDHLYYA